MIQMKNIINEKYDKWFVTIAFTMLIIVLTWTHSATPVASGADRAPHRYLHEGWSQQIDGELFPLDNIQDFYPVEEGTPLTFICTLPEIHIGDILLFYSKNQEVSCVVDGKTIHDFKMEDGFAFLKTPGSAWNQVDLVPSLSGKTCILTFFSPLQSQENNIPTIYYIDNVDVNGLRVEYLWFHGLVALSLFILAIITWMNAIIWKKERRKRYYYTISFLYGCMCFWILANLNFYDMFLGRPIMSYLIGEFFVRMIPMAFICLAKNSLNRYENVIIFNVAQVVAAINIVIPWILQFTFGISLLETRTLNGVAFAVVTITISIVIMQKIKHRKALELEEYAFLALGTFIIGRVLDIHVSYYHSGYAPYAGMYTVFGCIVYTVIIFILFGMINARDTRAKQEITQAYQLLQNTSLVQQMKVHFIFNVLNTISAYCKQDAAKADRAIQKFATYLRSYLRVITEEENIPIQLELDMVEKYLIIEQMRFEEKLSFVIDMQFDDFDVPPLSMQTLVENAMVHGIQKQTQLGKIMVVVRKNGNLGEVIVTDTGAGFDVELPAKEDSVGLKNLRRRLRIMSQGTLHINSKIGEGTEAVIRVPLHKI